MPFEVEHQVDLPEDTFLKAALKSLDTKEIPKRDPKPGESSTFTKLVWVFEITEQGEYFGKTVKAETSAFLSDSPYNVFRNWAEALLQRPLELRQVLNESDLVGLSGLITIKREADRKDATKSWPRVADVIPLDPASADGPGF